MTAPRGHLQSGPRPVRRFRANNKGRLSETSLNLALRSLSGECRLALLHAA
uniref:Uncharacterized protein n=1 Tax=Nonomuraea gerenzanensis TaxID=93944 RepID=A0A1M4ENI5_9ACTN|nr:hypothetical protein BN4615_P9904 [Nonomuraea gerenzanensis]